MNTDQDTYNELSYYTLAHGDPSFIHQHIVDAYAAQTLDEKSKPIKVTFALVGLFLYIEKQFTGRQVQLVHTKLSQKKQQWPTFALPENRGEVTIQNVLAAPAGPERDEMIYLWCKSVWNAYRENSPAVSELLHKHGII